MGRGYPWLADDFASDAALALWQAASRFDPARGEFARMVNFMVARALGRRLAVERRQNPAAFHQRAADGSEFDPLTQAAGREPEPGAAVEERDHLAALFARADLTPRHRDVFTRNVGAEVGAPALAAEAGVTTTRIRQIVVIARERLQAAAGHVRA